ASFGAVGDRPCDTRRRDGEHLRIERPDRLSDRAHGAGAAGGVVPAATPEGGLNGLELESRGESCPLEALGGQLAVTEEALAQADAAHLQALELEGGQSLTDDELGAATADVHHEAPAGLGRHGMR